MVYKYSEGPDVTESFRRAVLANANRGGENVATGALIGALLGANCGYSRLPADLLAGLAPSQREMLDKETTGFLQVSPFVKARERDCSM